MIDPNRNSGKSSLKYNFDEALAILTKEESDALFPKTDSAVEAKDQDAVAKSSED
jgi:hypothetical protein